jgi:hypothetical protein
MAKSLWDSLRETWWWKLLSDYGTLITFVPALGITAWLPHLKKMPAFAANPVEYFASRAFVFFGTWTAVIGTVRLVKRVTPRLKQWWNPSSLSVIHHVGEKYAAIEVTHHGTPATWEASIRIVKALKGQNPDPMTRKCFFREDYKTHRKLELRDGDITSIILAVTEYNEFSGSTWMSVQSADTDGTRIPTEGAVLEIELRTVSPQNIKPIKRCFVLTRPNPYGVMVLKDVDETPRQVRRGHS